jgi:transcriptional regulator with XRE-family HTH domain
MRKTRFPSAAESRADDRLYREVGIALACARSNAGLTQSTLAERAGLARTSVVNGEAGRQRLPLHVLARLARVCGVDLVALIPMSRARVKAR